MKIMEIKDIIEICYERFPGTVIVDAWGERGIFYNPEGKLKRGVYVMTVKQKDGDNDKGSKLNREGIYRINTGISKERFKKIYGYIPARPEAGGIVDMSYDFTVENAIIPHPVYAWMGWICVLNPTEKIFDEFMKYIEESYEMAKVKYQKRIKKMK